jgi:hypothetical protein
MVSTGGSENESVRVVIRCRPFNRKETEEGHFRIIKIDENGGVVHIQDPLSAKSGGTNAAAGTTEKSFTFDNAFGEESEQGSVYQNAARPIVECVLSGYNGTIFA